MWDGDLADMNNISKLNNGFKYLLVLIDIFSRYLIMVPLKDKTHQSVIKALTKIFQKDRKPKVLRTDKGSEFKNRWVKKFLHDKGISTIYTQNETKANYAERVIRTMKNMMYRYFMKFQTYKYIDILQKLVETYNTRPHRSLDGMAPQDVTHRNADEVRLKMYLARQKGSQKPQKSKKVGKNHFAFKIGDTVRISQLKRPFQKDYDQKWTDEFFKIIKRYKRDGLPVYQLDDLAGEHLNGTFYQQELQKVVKSDNVSYRVEKIIKRRGRGQNKEVLIKDLESEQTWHLGGGVYASITPDYPTVNIRHFWQPDDATEPVPTKRGIILNNFRFGKLQKAMEEIKDCVPEMNDVTPCMYSDDHMNQEGMLRCRECNPFEYEMYC